MATLDKAYFEARITKMPSGCWHWLLAQDGHGYGAIGKNSKTYKAYRVAYTTYKGPIGVGQVVRHTCHNPICVNPDHLVLGTQFENCQDTVQAGRTPAGDKNGMSKLIVEQVKDIRASFPKLSRKELASKYSITLSMVCKILNRKTWRHI